MIAINAHQKDIEIKNQLKDLCSKILSNTEYVVSEIEFLIGNCTSIRLQCENKQIIMFIKLGKLQFIAIGFDCESISDDLDDKLYEITIKYTYDILLNYYREG